MGCPACGPNVYLASAPSTTSCVDWKLRASSVGKSIRAIAAAASFASRGHWQVNRYRDASRRSRGKHKASHCLMDAGLLSPDLECLRPSAPISGCSHQMAPWPEVTVDHRVRREEPLRMLGRLEALHLSLSSSCRPV